MTCILIGISCAFGGSILTLLALGLGRMGNDVR
jgi:hypothetical protein